MTHREVRRIRRSPDTIDGQIRIDGQKVCDCAENAHHCLPPGTYPLTIVPCRQHARKMPIISVSVSSIAASNSPSPSPSLCSSCHRRPRIGINTPMPRKCVQLCPGNGVFNRTDGAILVGEHLVPGCLKHPKTTFANLYERLRKSAERGHPITLTIRFILSLIIFI